jgi:SAM-dependent MidA family methyltransferase
MSAASHAQRTTLGATADRMTSSSDTLPDAFTGVLYANELLDAMPVHQVVMREDGLREVYVKATPWADGTGLELTSFEGPLSTPALGAYLENAGATLTPGWRADISLRAVDWIRDAARRLRRGFLLLIDYGHEAHDLFSAAHAGGSLTTYQGHRAAGPDAPVSGPAWLERPGEQDITAHVDFTSLRRAAEDEGLETLGLLDQTYFLLGLMDAEALDQPATSIDQIKRRLALKTLMMPGGLGSTMKVMLLCRGVGRPVLRGCSYGTRLT